MWTRLIAVLAMAVSAVSQTPTGPVALVGEYSDSQQQADGYRVQLWRMGDNILGLFLADGLSEDGPAGILQDVKFDPRSGKLSFDAKLTLGVKLASDNSQRPSRDFFSFRGTWRKDEISGQLTKSDLLEAAGHETSSRVRWQKQATTAMADATSYAEWKAGIDEMLRARGPKW